MANKALSSGSASRAAERAARLEWELQAVSDVGRYGMPVTPLSRDEVKDLVAYIHPRRGPS